MVTQDKSRISRICTCYKPFWGLLLASRTLSTLYWDWYRTTQYTPKKTQSSLECFPTITITAFYAFVPYFKRIPPLIATKGFLVLIWILFHSEICHTFARLSLWCHCTDIQTFRVDYINFNVLCDCYFVLLLYHFLNYFSSI